MDILNNHVRIRSFLSRWCENTTSLKKSDDEIKRCISEKSRDEQHVKTRSQVRHPMQGTLLRSTGGGVSSCSSLECFTGDRIDRALAVGHFVMDQRGSKWVNWINGLNAVLNCAVSGHLRCFLGMPSIKNRATVLC